MGGGGLISSPGSPLSPHFDPCFSQPVDVFAFGVVLWECASRLEPWAALQSPVQLIYAVAVLRQRPPWPEEPPGTPPGPGGGGRRGREGEREQGERAAAAGLAALAAECWQDAPGLRPRFADALRRVEGLMGLAGVPLPPDEGG